MSAYTPAEIEAILDGPSMVSLTGAYDFANPPNLNTEGLTIIFVFLVLAVVSVCMRMYTKWLLRQKLESEDCEFRCRFVSGTDN